MTSQLTKLQAINSLLDGQPLHLQSGTIAAVTVRIPWPNPFSSTVGLSLSGLQLQLRVSEMDKNHQSAGFADELAESVTSVAESFIQNELSENEEAQLRESIHLEQSPADDVPGSINPFLVQDHELPHRSGNDPEGVSIFAGLIENLLARFDFDASDIRFSLIHEVANVTLSVGRFRYFTAGADPGQNHDGKGSGIRSERTVEVQGISVTILDHTPSLGHDSPAATPRVPSPEASRSARESSDSEMDEETQLTMSQSLVSLPPRPERIPKRTPSPSLSTISSASATSSMYQSAVSTSHSAAAPPNEDVSIDPQRQSLTKDRTILSISEPIVIRLTTPAVSSSDIHDNLHEPTSPGKSGEQTSEPMEDNMKLDMSFGVIAVFLDARRSGALLSLVDTISRSHHTPIKRESSSREAQSPLVDTIDVTLTLKGLLVYIYEDSVDDVQEETSIPQFFERPLNLPVLSGGLVRIHIDTLRASTRTDNLGHVHISSLPSDQSASNRRSVLSCTVHDVSLLVFHLPVLPSGGTDPNSRAIRSFPLLITDHDLATSYKTSANQTGMPADNHVHPYSDEDKELPLPLITVLDWTSDRNRGVQAFPNPDLHSCQQRN